MTLQNRIDPFGDPVATPERGAFMGNRGCLHDSDRRIVRFSQGRRWISCLTEFKGRRRTLMTPGHYTELFFMDEATALAAGHRPCHECRRPDALRFREAWARAAGRDAAISFAALDRALHDERLESRGVMRRCEAATAGLPAGAMVAVGDDAFLVAAEGLRRWSPGGYGPPGPHVARATVLTPRSIVAAIAAGYAPASEADAG